MLRAIIELTKPRQTLLMIVTMIGAYIIGGGDLASRVFALLLLTGVFSIGGATALNMYMEYDIDRVMKRTSRRPLPSGLVSRNAALTLSIAFMGLGVFFSSMINNAVVLSVAAGYYFYILSYTSLTKRYFPLASLLLGSIAGSMPTLGGWAAAKGYISVEGVLLASLVFLWQPGHVALLSYYYRDDYKAAGVRVLTESSPEARLKLALVASTTLLIVVIWLFVLMEGIGFLGALASSLLATRIIREAEKIREAPSKRQLIGLFRNIGTLIAIPYTIIPLEALFVGPFYLAIASLIS